MYAVADGLATVAYGPPLTVDRFTLYPVAPALDDQARDTLPFPGVAVSPAGAAGGAGSRRAVPKTLGSCQASALRSIHSINGSRLPPSWSEPADRSMPTTMLAAGVTVSVAHGMAISIV